MSLLASALPAAAPASPPAGGGFDLLGWSAGDLPLLLVLPVLLVFSATFSGAETALFGMSEDERLNFRQTGGIVGRAVEALLADQRMLLITLLLGNMAINVLFFVISSMLMLRAAVGVVGELALALAFLLLVVLFGEVTPKMLANTRRAWFATLVAPPMLALHGAIAPLRIVLNQLVVAPLSRLTAPRHAPPQLEEDELKTLLDVSGQSGVIDEDEQRVLRDVLELGRLRVRDVMTPRVRIVAVPLNAARDDVVRIVERTRFTKLPVYDGDLDTIVGLLHVKRYLLDTKDRAAERAGRAGHVDLRPYMTRMRFVPHLARLDQLLDHFRTTHTALAIVVDEYGGTEGIVAIKDVVEELVGEIAGPTDRQPQPPMLIGPVTWRVDGNIPIHDWAEAFGQELVSPRVATLAGLILEHLGRAARPGDVVELANVRLTVETMKRRAIASVLVTLLEEPADDGRADDGSADGEAVDGEPFAADSAMRPATDPDSAPPPPVEDRP